MNSPVSYSLDGKLATITFDDGKANALSADAIGALLAAIERAEGEAGALVLAGRPDRFCAGFDLRTMLASAEAATTLLARGAELYFRLYGSPLPVVLACTGHAMAGGALLLLTGDRRFGARGAYRIGLNEVAIGMPVPRLGVELARDRLVPAELGRATVGAQIYDPEGACAAGFLDEVVSAEEVLGRAKDEALRLAALPRVAYAATKDRLRGRSLAYMRETLEADMAALSALLPRA